MLEVKPGGGYIIKHGFTYHSERYGADITVPNNYETDGASGPAVDITSRAWVVHDVICDDPFFDDGSPIDAWMAATILSDILKSEGRWFRARTWRYATFLFGCKKTRKNGWW